MLLHKSSLCDICAILQMLQRALFIHQLEINLKSINSHTKGVFYFLSTTKLNLKITQFWIGTGFNRYMFIMRLFRTNFNFLMDNVTIALFSSHSYNECSINFNYINQKSVKFLLGLRTWGHKMEDEVWRLPFKLNIGRALYCKVIFYPSIESKSLNILGT